MARPMPNSAVTHFVQPVSIATPANEDRADREGQDQKDNQAETSFDVRLDSGEVGLAERHRGQPRTTASAS